MRSIVSFAILFRLALAAQGGPTDQPQSKPGSLMVNDGSANQDSGSTFTPIPSSETCISRSETFWHAMTSRTGVSQSVAKPTGSGRIGMPRAMSESEAVTAMRASLGRANSSLRLEITAISPEVLPPGEATFPLAGASKPPLLHPGNAVLWRGTWRTPDGRVLPVWARVRALCPRDEIRLRTNVHASTPMTTSMIERASSVGSAFREDPPETIAEYEGKVLKHFAKAGSVLSPKQVVDAPVVFKNAMVPVEVNSGGLRLHLEARAVADGKAGESIRLAVPGGHRQFSATVQADGSAVVRVAVDSFARESAGR